ncbi:PREDICTED: leukocyte receptor cluster member 1 homolog [Priapulus caudatus]|uniref:Leukocyte receptor cluster member 1 homolog n=1 Tax=Priapulus caudatus TaxID=37621 RepID=A0ABM1F0S5_PRICU|nr:PREDICTED: leukocyte receptor cluster member 1 homolog [Priapulus caudatus]
MNILPKKRWHVRTKENIARVRRDEQQAREEEDERQRRRDLAEQEARTDTLRLRARKRLRDDGDSDSNDESAGKRRRVDTPRGTDDDTAAVVGREAPLPREHVNLFADLQAGDKRTGTNREYEEEKRAEQEKYEKQIGLLTYLGESAREPPPWYARSLPCEPTSRDDPDAAADVAKKSRMDPIIVMNKHQRAKSTGAKPEAFRALTSGGRREGDREGFGQRQVRISSPPAPGGGRRERSLDGSRATPQKKSQRKHKHKHKHRRRRNSDSNSNSGSSSDSKRKDKHRRKRNSSSGSDSDEKNGRITTNKSTSDIKTVVQLRAERLRREKEERARTERLLARVRGEKLPEEKAAEAVEKESWRYNSQFNPDFVRRPKPRHSI